jgi:predicted AlkP superfamily phosphohydrolase/phosphomutase/tetratricopeptide (TPR) repeat protein
MSPDAKRRRVLLIGWDAADWKVIRPLMDAGRMPHVRRLVEAGAMGQISTLHPPLSPMLWTSIATGKRPFKHGIHGFSEPTPDGLGIQPVTNLSRKSKAIWNILQQNGLRSIVIGWWPSHPAEPIDGVMVSDHFQRAVGPSDKPWPLPRNAVHPPRLAEILADLRMHPDLLTPEMVEPFIPLAREIDQDKDKRLAGCMRTLCECVGIHSAAAWLMDNEPWDFFAVYYDAIDHFCHGFMRYHPPRQSWISERDFDLYHNVVTQAYEFHDQMLGTLLRKAGGDVTVILMSDHGFHPDHLRLAAIPDIPAGPAIEHRDFGILAMRGAGIRTGELLHGASVLDIAPTIFSLYGLPVGEDMDGKVLTQALVEPAAPVSIPTWEDVPGPDGRHPPHTRLDPVAAHEALEQMIELGYIERPDHNREVAVTKTIQELRYNLGEAYQDDDRHSEALEIFRELHKADPDEQRFAVRLFASCQALGLTGEMREIVDDLDGRRRALFEEAAPMLAEFRRLLAERNEEEVREEERPEYRRVKNLARFQPAAVDYLKAQVLTAEKRYEEALASLENVRRAHVVRPGLFLQTADLYLKLGRAKDAEHVYRKALEIDPDNAQAHVGVCRVALRRRRFAGAAQSALDALQRLYRYPLAHYLLGQALTGLRDYPRAADAMRVAISLNPNFPEAHMRLAALLENRLGTEAEAAGHRALAKSMRARRKPVRAVVDAAERVERAVAPAGPGGVAAEMPPLAECLVVVSGLPRSGTSMIMQMLAAGGMPVLADGLREPDEDNPRGYVEFEPVKNLMRDSRWLTENRGKAVKIVAPLMAALPSGLPCRVILCERDLEEVLDSQQRMLERRGREVDTTPERRRMLREEYGRTLARVKVMLRQRPLMELLIVEHAATVSDAAGTADQLNRFLGGGLDAAKMAAAVDPRLHRNRATGSAH